MKKIMTCVSIQLAIGFWFIVLLFAFGNIPAVKAENTPSVEGEWEIISVSSDTERSVIGNKVSISRKGDGYEVKGINPNNPWSCTGNERRIVHTELEYLIDPTGVHEGNRMPPAVEKEFAGQKVPINISYTLSADGGFLTQEQDSKNFHWQSNPETDEVRNVRYDITPGFYKRTLKRVSRPMDQTPHAAVAQVESHGGFYFLTKDGRKVTGEDASKVPLEEGTKVVTGNDGHIKMTLPDDTTFTVGPNSDLIIDKFVYDSDKSVEKIMATMTKGVFRWVTGKVARKDPAQMKVTLPVGDLGIRGTDFETTIEPTGGGSVMLYFGQLEITEKKTGFKFLLEAGQKVTFGSGGSFSRPVKEN